MQLVCRVGNWACVSRVEAETLFMIRFTVGRPSKMLIAEPGTGRIVKQRACCMAAAGGCRESGICCSRQPEPGFRCNDPSEKIWVLSSHSREEAGDGPYAVHLGEEGHCRRRSTVYCQTAVRRTTPSRAWKPQ